jgi:hypothetical protein
MMNELKSRGANPNAPNLYSMGFAADEQTEEGRRMIAEENARKARMVLSARLRQIDHHFVALSDRLRSTVTRLNQAGKANYVNSVAGELGITPERLQEILEKKTE